jgi:hypothetical protein
MADPERYEAVPREHLIFQALRDEYPKSLSAKALMNRAALAWRQEPVPSFVSLCISFNSLNRHLSGTRWQAVRTGGTPDDHYSLSPTGAG